MPAEQITQTLTTPPAAPDRKVRSTFAALADAFLSWLVTFATQLITLITQINLVSSNVNANATAAAGSADTAAASAAAAVATASAALWSGVTTYTAGECAIGSDSMTYRSAQSGNTNHNPVGDDGTWWVALTVNADAFGTAAYVDTGTSEGNVVVLGAGGALPAVSGAALTGLPVGLVPLATVTASNSATVSFGSSYFTSTYDEYQLHISNAIPATDAVALRFTASVDNGSNWLAGSNYAYAFMSVEDAATAVGIAKSAGTSEIELNPRDSLGSDATEPGWSGVICLHKPHSTVIHKLISSVHAYKCSTLGVVHGTMSGAILTSSAVNAVRFAMSSGNIESGTFALYGVKKA